MSKAISVPDSDVLIVGDGPSACVSALSLAKAGARVSMLAPRRPFNSAAHLGQCLPPAGMTWMRALELDGQFRALDSLPIVSHRSVWGSEELASREMISSAHGPSWVLDRDKFDRMMLDAAYAAGAGFIRGELVSIERAGSVWSYSLRNGEKLETGRASFFLDATGRRSAAARKMGARRMRADRLVCVPMVIRSSTATDLDATTLLEANKDGWFFSCRISSHERLVSFYTDSDLLPSSRAGRKTRIESLLDQGEHLSSILERHSYIPLEASTVVPAHGSVLNPMVGEGWLATGEAALCLDPLCGDGLLGAMNAARYAALALVAAADGDSSAFSDYARRICEVFEQYRLSLFSYYAMEPRWRTEAFWARRC
jgi:flavin-dependent dehydrogenase